MWAPSGVLLATSARLGNFFQRFWEFVASSWAALPLQLKPTRRHSGGILSTPCRLLFQVLVPRCVFERSQCFLDDWGVLRVTRLSACGSLFVVY